MWFLREDKQRKVLKCVLVIVVMMNSGEAFASRLVNPKLDFRPEDNPVDKYSDLDINHKLYNVKVIVDAGRSKEPRLMDAEVFTDLDSGSGGKKRIQTNITIEISDEQGDEKKNKGAATEEDNDDIENASVPVFKGRPVDPNRNRPESKLFFDYSGSKEIPSPTVESFPRSDDEDSFRNINWYHFQPTANGYWTTAQPKTEDNFIPYAIGFQPSPSPSPYPDYLRVKPCYCKFHNDPPVIRTRPDYGRPIPYHRSDEVYFTRGRSNTDSSSSGVDDKLDFPFHAK